MSDTTTEQRQLRGRLRDIDERMILAVLDHLGIDPGIQGAYMYAVRAGLAAACREFDCAPERGNG